MPPVPIPTRRHQRLWLPGWGDPIQALACPPAPPALHQPRAPPHPSLEGPGALREGVSLLYSFLEGGGCGFLESLYGQCLVYF